MRDHDALTAFLAARSTMPFAWGRDRNDCVAWSLACALAQGWVPPRPLPRWSSRTGALRVVHRLGGLEAAIDQWMPRIAPAMAKRGDIAGVPDADLGVRLMIFEGVTLAGPGEDGVKRLPRAAATIAWSLG